MQKEEEPMISSALQRVVVRTLMGMLAEHGITSVEEQELAAILLDAKLAADRQECSVAIKYLKHADILQNGRGTRINLSGTGLALGANLALPAEVGAALQDSINRILGQQTEADTITAAAKME